MEYSKFVETMCVTENRTGDTVYFKDNPTKYIEIVTGVKYKWYQMLELWLFDKVLGIMQEIGWWSHR